MQSIGALTDISSHCISGEPDKFSGVEYVCCPLETLQNKIKSEFPPLSLFIFPLFHCFFLLLGRPHSYSVISSFGAARTHNPITPVEMVSMLRHISQRILWQQSILDHS